MNDDDMRTLDMQMQRPGPMGVKNVMVVHPALEKVADGDLLLVSNESGYYVDPENADDAVQSIKPQTTVKYQLPFQCTLFGIAYAAQQQQFSIEEMSETANNTPTCTVTGTNAVVNRSGDVINAFEKLTFGPIKNSPPPSWRQQSDATVTLRRVSPMVWRTNYLDLIELVNDNDLYALFQQEYKETCGYTMIPVLLAEIIRLDRARPNWSGADVGAATVWAVSAVGSNDRLAQDAEVKHIDEYNRELTREFTTRGLTGARLNDAIRDAFREHVLDLYYDCMRNQEMMSLARCPVDHHCETLIRF